MFCIHMSYSHSIDSQRCTVRFSSPQQAFCTAIHNSGILDSLVVSPDYATISFYATVACPLSHVESDAIWHKTTSCQNMPYPTCMDLAICLGKQLSHLEVLGYTFDWLDDRHIFMVTDHSFLCLDVDGLCRVSKENTIAVSRFPDDSTASKRTHIHLSPELANATSIPCILPYKSIYHSLGALVSHCLSNSNISLKDKSFLLSIVDTKLYWFILRCMNPSPESRTMLVL